MKRKKAISVGIIALMLFGAFTVLIGAGTENVNAASDDGLVAYYDFDEGAGAVLHDKSGNGNDGTIYGATWVNGIRGSGLKFDGVNDHVKISPSFELFDSNKVTISVWIKTSSDFNTSYYGVRIVDNTQPFSSPYQFNLGIQGNHSKFTPNAARFAVYDSSHNNYTVCGKTIVTDGRWHFIAGEYDGNLLSVYVDGKLDGQKTIGIVDIGDDNSPQISIGSRSDFLYDFFNGTIDEVRIYNRALSADEIQAHYDEIMNPPSNGGGSGGGGVPGFEVAYFIGALFTSSAMLYYMRRKP